MRVLFFTEKVIVEPLGIMYLAAALEEAGCVVEAIQIDRTPPLEYVASHGPYDYYCFSVITGNEKHWVAVAQQVREAHTKAFGTRPTTVFGGPHCTFNEYQMASEDGVDIVVMGEAEYLLPALFRKKIRGGIFHDRTLHPVDSFRPPARAFLYQRYGYLRDNSIHNFVSERGCPYRCSFCYNKRWNEIHSGQPILRIRDPEAVVDEIAQVKRDYPKFHYPWFVCDLFFGAQKEKLDVFQRAYARVALPIFCSTRANYVDEEMARLLKACNVYTVNLALEAADDHMRNQVLHKDLKKEDVARALRLLHKYGIYTRLQNMVGLPCDDPLEDAFTTLAFNYEHRPTVSWSSILQPYPGTGIERYVWEHGYGSTEPLPGSFFSTSALHIKHRKEIERLHKWWPVLLNHRWLYPLRRLLVRLPLPPAWLRRMWAAEKARQDDKIFEGAAHPK